MKRVITFALLFLLSDQLHAQPSWELVEPMPTARMDAASAVVDDTLYVMGGRQSETGSGAGSEGLVDVVEAYVPLTDTYTDTWLTDYPPLPHPAALQASAVVGRRIYLLGGIGPERQTLDCIWHWEPGEPIWTEGASLPSPLEGAAATTLQDDTILLIGGLTAGGEYMDEVLFLFPDTYGDSTEQAPELDQARAAAGAVRVRDVVLVTGGYFYGPMGNCELFGGVTWATGPPLPHPTGSHVTCVSEGRTFVIGGQGSGGPLAELLSLEELHGEWESEDPLTIPRARLAGGIVGAFLVAAGGMGPEGSIALDSVERAEVESIGSFPMEEPHPVQPSLRITLWPNPVSTHFTVTAELGARENWEMLLHSPTGQRVWSTSGLSKRVRVVAAPKLSLSSGVYFLSLRTTTHQTTTPVMVLE